MPTNPYWDATLTKWRYRSDGTDVAMSALASGVTATRVMYAGAGGVPTGDANFVYSGGLQVTGTGANPGGAFTGGPTDGHGATATGTGAGYGAVVTGGATASAALRGVGVGSGRGASLSGGADGASLQLISQAGAPSAPQEGDLWVTGGHLYGYLGGATRTIW